MNYKIEKSCQVKFDNFLNLGYNCKQLLPEKGKEEI